MLAEVSLGCQTRAHWGFFVPYALFVSRLKFSGKQVIFQNFFLENYLIFMCLIATLKVSWKAFPGAWYALYVNVYLNAY